MRSNHCPDGTHTACKCILDELDELQKQNKLLTTQLNAAQATINQHNEQKGPPVPRRSRRSRNGDSDSRRDSLPGTDPAPSLPSTDGIDTADDLSGPSAIA